MVLSMYTMAVFVKKDPFTKIFEAIYGTAYYRQHAGVFAHFDGYF